MVVVAQLVRASVCGTEGRGFEPRLPPRKQKLRRNSRLFLWDKVSWIVGAIFWLENCKKEIVLEWY
jgi:hypothetical protein